MRCCATTTLSATVVTNGEHSFVGGHTRLFEVPGMRGCAATKVTTVVVDGEQFVGRVVSHGCLRVQGCVLCDDNGDNNGC